MEQPTILRIKRRRRDDHETLDALVIESSSSSSSRPAKRTRAGDAAMTDGSGSAATSSGIAPPAMNKGIFRFAATVSPSTFTSEESKRSLKDRITSLIQHPPPRAGSGSSTPHRNSKFALSGTDASDGKPGSSASAASKASPALQHHEKARKQARYKLIQEKRSLISSSDSLAGVSAASKGKKKESWRRPTAPPIVRSTAPKATSAVAHEDSFRILEAAIESDSDDDSEPDETWQKDPMVQRMQAYSRSRQASSDLYVRNRGNGKVDVRNASKSKQELEEEDMMSNFIPMLQEYLSVADKPLESPHLQVDEASQHSPPSASVQKSEGQGAKNLQSDNGPVDVPDLSSGDADDSDSEYVYDVYYRDPVPAVSSTRTSSGAATPSFSTTGAVPLSIQEMYGYDVGSEAGLRRIGALTGLEDDELLAGTGGDGQDEDSSDEMANTDDEDSNEEDFYRNDYPEGEDDEEDEDDHEMDSDDEEDDY